MKTVSHFEPGSVNFFVVGGQLYAFDHKYKDIRPLKRCSQYQLPKKRRIMKAAINDLTGRSDGYLCMMSRHIALYSLAILAAPLRTRQFMTSRVFCRCLG